MDFYFFTLGSLMIDGQRDQVSSDRGIVAQSSAKFRKMCDCCNTQFTQFAESRNL